MTATPNPLRGYRAITPPPAAWDSFVSAHPDGHLLQLAGWGDLKSRFGWSARRVGITDEAGQLAAGALVLFRRLPLGLGKMGYLPAGPLLSDDPAANRALWAALDALRVAFLKAEPCNWYRARPDLADQLHAAGFQPSPQTVQPPRTIVIDLSGTEDDILRRMNQSTRYKCRLGPKKEVTVREGSRADVDSFTALMQVTGERDAFGVHEPAYYAMIYDLFVATGRGVLLLARYGDQDLAGAMAFHVGENAYYLYGASSNVERNRMPTYIVQWTAIQWAKRRGALRYDLWGVPDADEAALEAGFETRSDGLWGVYGFKRGFGGEVRRSVGAWDKVYNRAVYALYRAYLARRAAR
jgi:lipid II:glycine glycyltransferase (peptidoglycan interpeptide bridge formation enzyme)